MGAILDNNSVFLHIPKTGGNWVYDFLEAKNMVQFVFKYKHAGIERVQLLKGEIFENKPFVFCFVRNPYTWYESWFRHQTVRDWPEWGRGGRFHHPCAILDNLGSDDFNKFIENVLFKCPGFLTGMYHKYTQYADFIGKQEDLQKDFLKVMEKMNYKLKPKEVYNFPNVNVGARIRLKWDRTLKKEIYKTEFGAFKRYGYEKINKKS